MSFSRQGVEPTLSTLVPNSPAINEYYAKYINSSRQNPTKEDTDKAKEAMNGYCVSGKAGRFGVMTTARFAADFLKDRINPLVSSQLESDIINATCLDQDAPEQKYLERLISYTYHRTSSGEDRVSEVVNLLVKRLSHNSLLVVTKTIIAILSTIVFADRGVQDKEGLEEQDKTFRRAFASCLARVRSETTTGDGSAIQLLESYVDYMIAILEHMKNMTAVLSLNVVKEKHYNYHYLYRMEMNETIAGITEQTIGILKRIATIPVPPNLFGITLTSSLYVPLIFSSLCLYGFASTAIDIALVLRRGVGSRAGLAMWLDIFNDFEEAGDQLNNFFDSLTALKIPFMVHIPKFATLPPGVTSKVTNEMKPALANTAEPYDSAWVDATLLAIFLEAGLLKRVTKNSGELATPQASNSSSIERRDGLLLGAPFTMTRETEDTFKSEANTLDSRTVDLTAPRNQQPWMSTSTLPVPLAEGAAPTRFIIFTDDVLGKGSFGTVFKAWDEEAVKLVACKQIFSKRNLAGTGKLQEAEEASQAQLSDGLKSEFEVLTSLTHENIVSVYAFQSLPTVSRIFMEWVPGGSVLDLVRKTGRGLSVATIKKFIGAALRGLAFVHKQRIVHRDIKPGNMLIADGTVKLADFGTGTFLNAVGAKKELSEATDMVEDHHQQDVRSNATPTSKSIVGTVPYMSPESFRGEYGTATDIWAIGASTVHMYTAKAPWSERHFADSMQLVYYVGSLRDGNHVPSYTAEVPGLAEPSGDLRSFLNECFTFDFARRPSATLLLEHEFFKC